MRLIDADVIMCEFAEFVRASNNSDFAKVPTWNDAVSLVGSAPTIEAEPNSCEYWDSESHFCALRRPQAEPRKHGRWINEPNCWYRCSVCGEHYPSTRGYMTYNYCPNCGADMRGGENG